MTDTARDIRIFKDCLDEFARATEALNLAYSHISEATASQFYPACLPSFDEFSIMVSDWNSDSQPELNGLIAEAHKNESYRTQDEEIDILAAICDALEARGYKALLQRGGAGVPWIEIDMPSGKVCTLGLANDTWCGEIYPNAEALESCTDQQGYDTQLATSITDPPTVADAFVKAYHEAHLHTEQTND